jgi:hypothetical protein
MSSFPCAKDGEEDRIVATHLPPAAASSLSAISSAIPCNVFPTPMGLNQPAPKRRMFALRVNIVSSSARSTLRSVRVGCGGATCILLPLAVLALAAA